MSGASVSVQEAIDIAIAHQRAGRADLADAIYAQIFQAMPTQHDRLHVAGIIAHRRGDHGAAFELLKQSIALKPVSPSCVSLGRVLVDMGRPDEAVTVFKRALQLDANDVQALTRLAITLKDISCHAEAVMFFSRLLPLAPDAFETHAHYGHSLQALGRLTEAIVHYRRALVLVPTNATVWCNLGLALLDQGQLLEALAALRQSLALNPNVLKVHSNLLFSLMFDVDCTPQQYLDEARRFGVAVSASARPHVRWRTEPAGATVDVLRVGVVSGDLWLHAVGFFLENIISHIDSDRIQLVAYATTAKADELTARLRPHFSAWHDISKLTDEAAAQKVHDDGIHILVDLAGHTAQNRLSMFAWKPAPVQVSWLGYAASTGVAAIDWVLVDAVSVSAQEAEFYTERLWHMPDTRLCFMPPTEAESPAVSMLPALSNGYVTFGSFQSMAKLQDGVLALWARILKRMPQARLRVQNGALASPVERDYFLQRMQTFGITPERIVTAGRMTRAEYLAAHAAVDFILDTFPYPGGTTTCEALWMGVPTLTLLGRTFLARQGVAMLTAAGLPDWVAHDEEDYVQKAVAYAADIEGLARLRATLREQVGQSPLYDGERFARRLEDALHGMWRASAPDK